MSEFESLAAALEGHYEKSWADIPNGLRQRADGDLIQHLWDLLPADPSAGARRSLALQWDQDRDPTFDRERQEAWDSQVQAADEARQIKDLVYKIAALKKMTAPIPSEVSAKKAGLALLRQQLAELTREGESSNR